MFFVVVGEIYFIFLWVGNYLIFDVFVVEDLDVDVLVGILFMIINDIFVCLVKG